MGRLLAPHLWETPHCLPKEACECWGTLEGGDSHCQVYLGPCLPPALHLPGRQLVS